MRPRGGRPPILYLPKIKPPPIVYSVDNRDTSTYLRRIQEHTRRAPTAKQVFGRIPNEGQKTRSHSAFSPLHPYTDTEDAVRRTIWQVIAREFIKCHLPPEESTYYMIYFEVGDSIYTTYLSERPPDITPGDTIYLGYKIRERDASRRSRYDSRDIYCWLVNADLGTVDTRIQTMDSLIDKNLLYDTRRGFYTIFLSVKLIQLLEAVYLDILRVDLTWQIEQMIDNVETYDDLQTVAKRGRDIVTDVVYKLKEVKDNDNGR